jgi:NADH-quinone oxidoreductase subunit I
MRLGDDEKDYYVGAVTNPGASAGAVRPQSSVERPPGAQSVQSVQSAQSAQSAQDGVPQ